MLRDVVRHNGTDSTNGTFRFLFSPQEKNSYRETSIGSLRQALSVLQWKNYSNINF